MLSFNQLLPPLLGMGNDWTPFEKAVELRFPLNSVPEYTLPVSVVIPVYNRKEKLGKTIAALTHSTYPLDLIEVVIADDGSSDRPEELVEIFQPYFSIKHVFQEDLGFRLSEVRNLGIREAKHDCIIILDCDMLPEPTLVEAYMRYMHISSKIVLIGGRRYVNTDSLSIQDVLDSIQSALQLPTQRVDTGRGPEGDEAPSEDWRYKFYRETNLAKDEKYAFRWLCGGNLCIHRSLHNTIGGFDESFTAWGAEDQEYGFRLYRQGAWFIPIVGAEALHQEPPGGSNETDRNEGRSITRQQLEEKCPAMYRKSEHGRMYEVPKLTIYIPAYNCVKYIEYAVESALRQTFTDLEVVVCNDGSTDGTGELLDKVYGAHPRVKILHQENRGISYASNAAIRAGRGEYILQLDGDDILLPIAAEMLIGVFETSRADLGVVYGDTILIDEGGVPTGDAYSWSIYGRDFLLKGMRIHPPRMYRRRDFNRTTGFDESIGNAVDYDIFLKLSEVTTMYHVQTPLYLYRQHSASTSKAKRKLQDENNFYCVQQAILRNGLEHRIQLQRDIDKPRTITKELISPPIDYRLDIVHSLRRLGIFGIPHTKFFRWELDLWASKNTLKVSEETLNLTNRYIRLGPFSSPRDGLNAMSKIQNDLQLKAYLRSYVQGRSTSFHVFVVAQNDESDLEMLALRKKFQIDYRWPAEVVKQLQFSDVFVINNDIQFELDAYTDSIRRPQQEIQRYSVEEFWSIEGQKLLFTWRDYQVFFEMPPDWSMALTHPDLFQLAHHLLVEPWDKSVLENWQPTRTPGWRPGLAFSGGIDSSAAMALMPEETVLIYHERIEIESKLNHTNALRFFQKIKEDTGRTVHRIPSNHEQLRALQGKSAGFSTDYACALQVILLADYFGLDSVATGMPLENAYLYHGHRYRDFSTSWFWRHYSPLFKSVGLPLYQPVAGCSEVVNLQIVGARHWEGWAQSCLRSNHAGEVCGACWKCFRKNTMQGQQFTLSDEISTFLEKQPLKQAASTLFSIQLNGVSKEGINIRERFSHLNSLLVQDWSFLRHHYEQALDMIPPKYREFTRLRLQEFSSPMTEVEIARLKSINLYPELEP